MASNDQRCLKKLKTWREEVNWAIEKDRRKFFHKFYALVENWEGQLPNLRDIFQSEEIDWLLTEEIENDKNSWGNFTGWPLVRFVIRAGYRDEPESSGLTHFHVACKHGCDEVVERFLELGQDPDCLVPKTGDSPLNLALRHGHKRVLELLLKYGADPNLTGKKDGSSPLHLIWVQSSDDVMEIFFQVCDEILENAVRVDARDKLGRTPLCLALQRGKNKAAEILLRRGADPNSTDAEGSTPLHVMCNNRNVDFTKIFFKICDEERKVVQVDARDDFGRTPLHLAVLDKNEKLAELLLRRGADPNLAGSDGLTALHIMCKEGKDDGYDYVDDDLVELFFRITDEMQLSVKVDAVDKKGNTPLSYALKSGVKKVIELLLRNGADPNLADAEGLTPLHVLCKTDYFLRNGKHLLEMFFELNKDKEQKLQVDARDKKGDTPLHLALKKYFTDNNEVVKVLLMNGANLNLPDANGSTPLHIVCQKDLRGNDENHHRHDLLRMFFEVSKVKNQPVRVDAFDKEGSTPLHLALNRNIADRTIVTLLLRNGANPNLADAKGSTALHMICQRKLDVDMADTFFEMVAEQLGTVRIDALDKQGNTPLHLALSHDYKAKAESLLRRGASPNSVDADGSTPLHVICKRYREEYNFVKIFFEICDEKHVTVQINARDKLGWAPLHLALDRCHKNVAELLLRRRADPNLADAEGLTPLHVICKKEDDKDDELLKLFFKINDDIEQTVLIDARDSNGNTPLHVALSLGKKEATELLFGRGADHNLADDDGSTPLHIICQREDCDDLLKIFFKFNCKLHETLDACDVVGRTPLHWAVASLLPDMVDFLLNSGADVSGFVFPTDSHFVNKNTSTREPETIVFRTISIVESLEKRGYRLNQTAALTIMKTFAKHGTVGLKPR
ncbi:ankyrin-1-like [Trichogramma pretiosum]|uniref:ankyrin-1-like n=1 Tax=Trichogramma pretiosum TaxID=7493 RepID=UPI0006C9951B|nr:ankyrin-1-like [Trichogramma pretiosum]